jgi:hypothetical protein
MAIARDLSGNLTGQSGGGYRKEAFEEAYAEMWIMYVYPPNSYRKLEATGGVWPWSGKRCPISSYTSIIR